MKKIIILTSVLIFGIAIGTSLREEKFIPTLVAASESPALRSGDPLPENIFVELAKAVNPSIVNVAVSFHARGGVNRDPIFDLFEQFMGPQGGFPGAPQQLPQREAQGVGTGFIIESNGLIVTNNHVIDGADEIKVQMINEPGKYHDATVVGRDPRTDIALIKIKSTRKDFPILKLGNSKDVQVGQWVAAFGNPYGHTFSVSKGIVSALGRQIREINAVPFIQTDASINPGNSGGPLVNTKGEVIGVNAAIDARAQGIGFAIPIDHVRSLIPQLKEKGKIIRGYIGVGIDEINPRAKQALNLPVDDGALIMSVADGGPADKGGIEPYDVIVEFNGKNVNSPQDLSDAVVDSKIGSSANVVLYRNGKKMTKSVTISDPPEERKAWKQGRRPPQPGSGESLKAGTLGFGIADFTDKKARELGIPPGAPKKPFVTEVQPGSPAAIAGLRPGDIILDVNKTKVSSAADVWKNLREGSNMIRVQNGNQISLVFLNAN